MSATGLPDTTPTKPVAVRAGDQAPYFEVGPVTRTQIVRYAGASGDFNPIHHDEQFATAAGMPSIFAMGLMHGGMLTKLVARWLGLPNVRTFSVRFTGQVWPGDTLTFAGLVDSVEERDGERLAECSFTVTRQTGDEAIKAKATALVAEPSG